jgi:CubicO group peptidase (beta-lactamase class C family)
MWMEGFPPPPEVRIRFDDGSFYSWPQLRWTFSNIQQLVPTRSVWRGPDACRPLAGSADGLGRPSIRTTDGRDLTWDAALDELHTDGLVVLHRGRLVHEEYRAHGDPRKPHIIMSAAKSVIGTLAMLLDHEGLLDRDAPVTDLVPELAGSAWDDATVRQVMDMLVGMEFHEDYLDGDSEVFRYLRSAGMLPFGPDHKGPRSFYEYLPTIRGADGHGRAFAYREPNINVLGWIVRRASGQGLADLASERIWRHLGAEQDATFMVDSSGAETTMNMTTRDFARFGDLFRTGGMVGGVRVLPAEVADEPFLGGDQDLFALAEMEALPDWSYRSQWWIRHMDDRVRPMARGAHGQLLAIDRLSGIVVAHMGSAPRPPSTLLDNVMQPLLDAIIAAVV